MQRTHCSTRPVQPAQNGANHPLRLLAANEGQEKGPLYQSHIGRHAKQSEAEVIVWLWWEKETLTRSSVGTHPGTPVAIFCIERVPRLDGLLVRSHVLPSLSLFVRLTCAGPFLRHRQRSQCGLSIGAFFRRRGLAH